MQPSLEIDVQSVKTMLDCQAEFLFIDCREPDEASICQIDGAKLLPMNETPQRLAELEPWKGKPVVVHCHGGVRSLNVASWLRQNGFPQAQSMAGGIDAWSVLIDPAVPRYQ